MPLVEPYPKKQIAEARAPRIEAVTAMPTRRNDYGGTGTTATYVDPWPTWNITYTTNSITTATTSVWNVWNTTAITSTTTASANVWTVWSDGHGAINLNDAGAAQRAIRHQQAQPTAEQREQWRRQELDRAAAEEKRKIDVALARGRAKTLLLQCLSPEQRESVAKKDCFYMECHSANGTKRRYRIDTNYTHGNVKLVDDKNSIIGQYCVQPNGVPIEDAVLAQKLWLETNEDEFKRKANFTPARLAA